LLAKKFEKAQPHKGKHPLKNKMTTPIEQWKAIKDYHEAQILKAQKMLDEFEKNGEPKEQLLTQAEMKKRIIEFETRTAYKHSWKKNVNEGLLENMQHILNEDTYHAYLEVDVPENATEEEKREAEEKSKKIQAYLGSFGNLTWQLFVLKVIKKLHDDGSFYQDGEFDTFEDTAGGCDEITWDVGVQIIEAEIQ